MYRHQFGGDCQVMMAEWGEKGDENVADEDLLMKRNGTSAIWTHFGFTGDDVLQWTSITTCSTTKKTYKNNSKLRLAIIICRVKNVQTSIFVYLSQVILSSHYLTHSRFFSYHAGLLFNISNIYFFNLQPFLCFGFVFIVSMKYNNNNNNVYFLCHCIAFRITLYLNGAIAVKRLVLLVISFHI